MDYRTAIEITDKLREDIAAYEKKARRYWFSFLIESWNIKFSHVDSEGNIHYYGEVWSSTTQDNEYFEGVYLTS